jgi:hypothetical protein
MTKPLTGVKSFIVQKYIAVAERDAEKEDEEKSKSIEILALKPTFSVQEKDAQSDKNKPKRDNINKKDDNGFIILDLFALIESGALAAYKLPNISLNQLDALNITRAFVVVDGKHNIVNIIVNKGGNAQQLLKLLSQKVDNKLRPLTKPSPFPKLFGK